MVVLFTFRFGEIPKNSHSDLAINIANIFANDVIYIITSLLSGLYYSCKHNFFMYVLTVTYIKTVYPQSCFSFGINISAVNAGTEFLII
jgi:hypothetical protein